MIHVGGRTPYQVLYGRQPHMLPGLLCPADGEEGVGEDATGLQQARVREISLQSMIQATTMARVSRSLKTRTTPSGLSFQPGDLVDFHRPPSNKGTSGWHGPMKVLSMIPLLERP